MSSSEAIISVVLPVHSRSSLLRDTLDSIARQSTTAFRLFIVENNADSIVHDIVETWTAANSHRLDITLLAEPQPGASAARNCGLAVATTPWVMFFDSDDLMAPSHIASIIDAILANPHADIIGWNLRVEDAASRKELSPYIFHTSDLVFNNLFHGTMGTLRWAARTDLVRRAGGWDTSISLWDDVELGMRMLALRPMVIKRPGEVSVTVLRHSDSLTAFRYFEPTLSVERAMDSMEVAMREVFPSKVQLLSVMRAIIAGKYSIENHLSDARRLLDTAMSMDHRLPRWLLKTIFHYTSRGGRGVARILRPFL